MTEKEFTEKDETEFKAYLESIGDSIVCVADDDIVKIHVHTNDPGLAIESIDLRTAFPHENRQYARRASGKTDRRSGEAGSGAESGSAERAEKIGGIYCGLHRFGHE